MEKGQRLSVKNKEGNKEKDRQVNERKERRTQIVHNAIADYYNILKEWKGGGG